MNNADLVEQIISLLDQATFMGGLAAIIFFLIPLLQLIVTAVAWVWGMSILVKAAHRLLYPLTIKTDLDGLAAKLGNRITNDVRAVLPELSLDEQALRHALEQGLDYSKLVQIVLDEAEIDLREISEYPSLSVSSIKRRMKSKQRVKVEQHGLPYDVCHPYDGMCSSYGVVQPPTL